MRRSSTPPQDFSKRGARDPREGDRARAPRRIQITEIIEGDVRRRVGLPRPFPEDAISKIFADESAD
jgi:hypothetical protein